MIDRRPPSSERREERGWDWPCRWWYSAPADVNDDAAVAVVVAVSATSSVGIELRY